MTLNGRDALALGECGKSTASGRCEVKANAMPTTSATKMPGATPTRA